MIGSMKSFYYPNKLFRILLLSMEEIIGHNGMNAVLNQADLKHLINDYPPNDFEQSFCFDEVSRVLVSLEQLYGTRSGWGLALRSGRVFFQIGIREFAEELGIKDSEFRLLPLDRKIFSGLVAWAKLINDHSDQKVRLEDLKERILWIVEPCPLCWGYRNGYAMCYLEVGMLQEALYWMSGGKFFTVDEIQCKANGDSSCTIAIMKTYNE